LFFKKKKRVVAWRPTLFSPRMALNALALAAGYSSSERCVRRPDALAIDPRPHHPALHNTHEMCVHLLLLG